MAEIKKEAISKEIKYNSTIHAFIKAKEEIQAIKNNAQAFNFKFADLVATQDEVNRVLNLKGLNMISMNHTEISNERKISIVNNRERETYISKGSAQFIIGSIWDNVTLSFEIPAVFENGKPHDATYGANSIAYRYFLLRAFGIPTMDENDARLKDKELKEKELKKETKTDQVQKNNSTEFDKLYLQIIHFIKEENGAEYKKLLSDAEINSLKNKSIATELMQNILKRFEGAKL